MVLSETTLAMLLSVSGCSYSWKILSRDSPFLFSCSHGYVIYLCLVVMTYASAYVTGFCSCHRLLLMSQSSALVLKALSYAYTCHLALALFVAIFVLGFWPRLTGGTVFGREKRHRAWVSCDPAPVLTCSCFCSCGPFWGS